MRRKITILIIGLLLLLAGGGFWLAKQRGWIKIGADVMAEKGIISGNARSLSTGKAVANADIWVTKITEPFSVTSNINPRVSQVRNRWTQHISTNQDGDFIMQDIPLAKYKIEVEKSGFKKLVAEDISLTKDPIIFNVRMADSSAKEESSYTIVVDNLGLVKQKLEDEKNLGGLKGKVTKKDGSPLTKAWISFSNEYVVQTDEQGNYESGQMLAGTYGVIIYTGEGDKDNKIWIQPDGISLLVKVAPGQTTVADLGGWDEKK